MADDTRDARPTGTLWLVVGLVSGALLVTGAAIPAWTAAAALALSALLYVRARTRPATPAAPPTGTLWFVLTLIVGALLASGRFDPPWIGGVAFATTVLLYVRASARRAASPRPEVDPAPPA